MTTKTSDKYPNLLAKASDLGVSLEKSAQYIKATNGLLMLKLDTNALDEAVAFTKMVLNSDFTPVKDMSAARFDRLECSIEALANFAQATKDGVMAGRRSNTDSILEQHDPSRLKDIFKKKILALNESAAQAATPITQEERNEAYVRYKNFVNERHPLKPDDI